MYDYTEFPDSTLLYVVMKEYSEAVVQRCSKVFLRPATLLKKRLWHSCFPVNFVKLLRTPFFIEHL